MSLKEPIRDIKRYVRRFPNTVYPRELREGLDIALGPSESASPSHQQDLIATPHCLSYRIPKDRTKDMGRLLHKLTQLNEDSERHRNYSSRVESKFFQDILYHERETKRLLRATEDMWDRVIQGGMLSYDFHLRYQFKQFKKVPQFQNHPRQILLELRLLKQAHQQRIKGVNSPETHHGGHDAALILVTPGLAKLVGDKSFEDAMLQIWPDEARGQDQYHLVMAVVDGTHLADEDSSSASDGISIIRGSKAIMFPDLWEEKEPRETEVKDDVGALTFDIGGVSTVTVPLANTLFQNGKMSTLQASINGARGHLKSKDLFEQRIRLPSMAKPKVTALNRSITNLRLPLEPITDLRKASESFGNILRRIKIDGESKPASIELEKAVTSIQDRIAHRARELGIEFPGVWAVVYENEKGHIPMWHVETRSPHDKGSGTAMSILPNPLQLEKPAMAPNPIMGRPFKLLSGGGGWGDKAGLLAFDPQTSHFAKSESEMTSSLFGHKGASTYIPKGAAVQFYISDERQPAEMDQPREYDRRGGSRLVDFPVDNASAYFEHGDVWYNKNKDSEHWAPPEKKPYFGTDGVPRLMFGVGSRLPPLEDHDTEMVLHVGEFGVLSNKAIYVAESEIPTLWKHPGKEYAPPIKPMKLDMPGAQVKLFNW